MNKTAVIIDSDDLSNTFFKYKGNLIDMNDLDKK